MFVEFVQGPRILSGLAAIGEYLRVSPRTVRRWVTQHGLPAMRYPARKYTTSTALIDLWILTWGKELSRKSNAALRREVDVLTEALASSPQ